MGVGSNSHGSGFDIPSMRYGLYVEVQNGGLGR